jgi:hypothetical protein
VRQEEYEIVYLSQSFVDKRFSDSLDRINLKRKEGLPSTSLLSLASQDPPIDALLKLDAP